MSVNQLITATYPITVSGF